MDNNQRLVECLQEDLAASKGRCDGLQQAVSGGGREWGAGKQGGKGGGGRGEGEEGGGGNS